MDKEREKVTDPQGRGTTDVRSRRRRKVQKEKDPSESYKDNRVKIGPSTWNGLRHGIPYLKLPTGLVLLDTPRADFDPFFPNSESYFVSNTEYQRITDLQKPDPAVKSHNLPWSAYNFFPSYRSMSWRGRRGRPELDVHEILSPEGPGNLPWIFNTVYLDVKGTVLQIRWGPHYQEPLQGMYYEVSIAGAVIWATSPCMYRKVQRRERQPNRYVFNNTHLPISVKEGTVHPSSPHPHCIIPARPSRQTELKIYGHPLYMTICIQSEVGLAYDTYREKLATSRYTLAGPQVQPDSWIVYQWKWVWKGLEPGLPYPSPIYQALLKGRVDRGEEADLLELAGFSRG
ncbi:hypothetical protein ATANTOWER_032234 [Ataeniobius toweri]|uniref:Uncharacterized protein n=1 Tax=Ataeniobius toweri TaxID=208326 RepID=A0ABU7BS68_9TELE|nr:hypothetical protein [Ataeniobius toweri]